MAFMPNGLQHTNRRVHTSILLLVVQTDEAPEAMGSVRTALSPLRWATVPETSLRGAEDIPDT